MMKVNSGPLQIKYGGKEKERIRLVKAKCIANHTIAEVLSAMDIEPDFSYTRSQENQNLMFVHRKLDDIDIYWINNRNNFGWNTEATFRVEGKVPEIWYPQTGIIEDASYTISNGHTTVSIKLEPNDAVFIVYRKKSVSRSLTVAQFKEAQLALMEGPWKVSFQPGRGAPAQIEMDQLTSWSENIDPGVKYFSGTGSYIRALQVSDDWIAKNTQVWIDLGEVKNIAEVIVNGKSMGTVWKAPFRVNITGAIKTGENIMEIKVTNLWVNRLIGDQQPGIDKKITYTTQPFYPANSDLLPSGLMGPVKIIRKSKI